jgi:polysaccharide biosynthesis transport protein
MSDQPFQHEHDNAAAGGGRSRVPALSAGGRSGGASEVRPVLYAPDYHDGPALDYRRYIGLLIKHRWLIAGIAAVSVGIALFYTLLQTPTYRASATIQIKREAANISGIAGLESVEAGGASEFYQTQYELLQSRSLAKRIVSSLGLADTPRLYEPRPSGWAKLRDLVLSPGHAEAPDISARESMAVRAVLDGVSVEPVRSSSIVRINFDSADAELARQVADAIAENFIASNIERNFEASAFARQFLEDRLQELRLKLEESERDLVAYAEKQDILVTGSEQSLSTVNLAETNAALGEASKARLRHELRWRQAAASAGADLPQSLETEAIQDLRALRNELSLDYENKLQDFKPAYPEMVRLRIRIDEVDRQIETEVDRIRESLRMSYESALQEEQALLRQVGELKSEVMDYQNRNIRYTILQREVDTNRSLYEGLLQRYKEIGVAGGIDSQTSNVSFVDRAEVPASPYKPRLALNLAGALAFGLVLGGAAAFGREYFDNSFQTPEDLEDGLGLPLLGIIPACDDIASLGKTLDHPRSAPGEAFRSLRTALQFSTAAGMPKSLVVTSALSAEGKSTAAANLAAQFARIGYRVLLVDADMRKPSLHRLLGCDGSLGLSQYLARGHAPPEALQETAVPGLTLLASGPVPHNPAELLSGTMMASLICVGTEEFDLVIVDAPPVGGLADAPLLASMCRGTLLVVEANKTHRRAVTAALKRLRFARAEVVGAVLNKFDSKHLGYGYGFDDSSFYGDAEAPHRLASRTG